MSYRSLDAPAGYFRRPAIIHAHIDAGSHINRVPRITELIQKLEGGGHYGKLNELTAAIKGPQRDDKEFRQTYEAHTPGDQDEDFAVFSTTNFGPKVTPAAIGILSDILETMKDAEGTVIEVERIIASIDGDGNWLAAKKALIPTIADEDIMSISGSRARLPRCPSFPIEIHHAIDFLECGDTPPVRIADLMQQCTDIGLNLGGLFLFKRPNGYSFRSSQFATSYGFENVAREQHGRLRRLATSLTGQPGVWTIVEQILGIWKIGHVPDKTVGSLDIPQLARWEMDTNPDDEIWIVARNFLGDSDPDVRQAMEQNIAKGVRYTYFLQSFADVQRLRQLIGDLESRLGASEVLHWITAVHLWPSGLKAVSSAVLHNDYFIKNPRRGGDAGAEGYRLGRSLPSGQALGGDRVHKEELDGIVRELRPLVEAGARGFVVPMVNPEPQVMTVMFTDLEGSTRKQNEFYLRDEWEQVLEDYDAVVAGEVSKCEGEVVKALGDGYLIVFKSPIKALQYSKRLEAELRKHNERFANNPKRLLPTQKVALECGEIHRVMRSHGYDYTGRALSNCAKLLALCPPGYILATHTFYQLASGELPAHMRSSTFAFYETIQIPGGGNVESYRVL